MKRKRSLLITLLFGFLLTSPVFAIMIEDGKGTGIKQQVNAENQAVVRAITETLFEQESSENGNSYNWSSGIIDIDTTDTVFLLKNTSDDNLHIESISIWNGSVASQYTVHLPTTEVTVTGTTVTGTNLNTASANVADASAASDETNNSQGNLIFDPMIAVDDNITLNTVGLILGKNKSVAIDVVAETTESGVTIRAHYGD